jgi:ketosteroid isomerase-like protein
MATSGLDVVRQYRELVSEKRFDEALGFLSEDLEFTPPTGPAMTFAELKNVWTGPPQEYENLTMDMVTTGLHDVGQGRYLGESDQVFRWKETGEISNVEHRAMLFELADGKIRRMKFFTDPADAWTEAGAERP